MKYNPQSFESKWQKKWEENAVFKTKSDKSLKKFYCLEMLPYPSGNIHMGHVRNYSIGDALARYKMMNGFNLLHPMGWDAFGLPAENAAKQNKRKASEWTYDNIRKMRSQLKRLGFSYDWKREVTTCDPEYYRWEQMIFIKMWERGLVYRKLSTVNWCDDCETVLANEQVEDGKCWRCGHSVRSKDLEQWFLKITDYADELLEFTDKLPGWPQKVLTMQKNWIGKSVGAEIKFDIVGSDKKITVFTTRADTLFGATFMLLAPEYPLVPELIAGLQNEKEIYNFIKDISKQDKIERTNDKLKKGIFTGRYVINPATKEAIPIYLANYVLTDYGTGAVMAVPAHDERDFDFAKKYNLPIKVVISPKDKRLDAEKMEEAYTDNGVLVNSSILNGLDSDIAIEKMVTHLGEGCAKRTVNYRLRDWGISRQRYWGAPIPFIYCDKCGLQPVPFNELPVKLPQDVDFAKSGNPLEHVESFIKTKCPKCGGNAKRETDTMDTFMESSWYFLRYISPTLDTDIFDKDDVNYYMPVDQYIGGIEHAVMHLLYARFFTKVLRDMGYLNFDEPFTNLLTQGMVCMESIQCPNDGYLYPDESDGKVCKKCGAEIIRGRVEKMSKSKKNVVDPDVMNDHYGADTIRLFSLFAAPPQLEIDWNENGVEGAYRFLSKVYRLVKSNTQYLEGSYPEPQFTDELSKEIMRVTHVTIKRVTNDIERFQFNTAIAGIMEMVNNLTPLIDKVTTSNEKASAHFSLKSLLILLTPFTPHIAEELWSIVNKDSYISLQPWVKFNDNYTIKDEIIIVVQINGKVRAELNFARGVDENTAIETALKNEKVLQFIDGKEIVKKIFVKDKLISFVVK